jgi:Druantia protein DruA
MAGKVESFSGRDFRAKDLELICEVVTDCAGLSRMELAHTVCELVGWRRPNGSLKARECREFLERLDERGVLTLPDKRPGRPVGSVTAVPRTTRGESGSHLGGSVRDIEPITFELVAHPEQRLLFRELLGRYHYLGHKVPFGAHLRYLVFGEGPEPKRERVVLGCLQYSSPAWRMAARDRWIGWDDAARARNLQHVINNSRFLLLPWLQVKNLASAVLARGRRQVLADWPRHYKVEPWLLETLVDSQRYHGGCYRAANWHLVGETTGRGRMDRRHRREGEASKSVLVYPLVDDATRRLREA